MIRNRPWDASFTYEVDHKQSKFLAKEKSYILKLGPESSNWRFKLESTRRKNCIEHYSSREFLENESVHTYKQSLGLEYVKMTEQLYKKLDIEMALPEGLGFQHNLPSFFKVDGFYA